MYYGQSTLDIRSLAYQMAKINNINYPNTYDTNEHGFLKRSPDLSIREAEGCNLSRIASFNYHNVTKFYENLEVALKRFPGQYADGSRVFYLDETATTTVQKPKKIVT
ncbi:hypothetical protein QE152_g11291 [Popillia japonica]|uniref:Uncharacterized protein n=1 Tax=Popillia japonica TaxID=7064 RepID=A0AAW1LSF8_POPJA